MVQSTMMKDLKKKSDYDLVVEEVLSPQEILDYIIEKTGFKNEL